MAIRPITSTRPSRNVTHGNRHGTVRFLLWEIPTLLLLDHKRPKGHHLCLAFEIWGERNPTSHVNFCTGQWSTERERERERESPFSMRTCAVPLTHHPWVVRLWGVLSFDLLKACPENFQLEGIGEWVAIDFVRMVLPYIEKSKACFSIMSWYWDINVLFGCWKW